MLDNAIASDSNTIKNSSVLISAVCGLNKASAKIPINRSTEFRIMIFLIFAHIIAP